MPNHRDENGLPLRGSNNPTDYIRAGEGDRLNLLYEKVITGNGDDSLIIKHEKMLGRMGNAEERMDRLERAQLAINSKFWAIVLMLGTAIITTTTAIVLHAVSSSQHSSMF